MLCIHPLEGGEVLREQVITPRAGRSATGGKGRAHDMAQRPSRREGRSAHASGTSKLRSIFALLPLVGKILLAVCMGVLIFAGYRAATSAVFFRVRTVDVSGTTRASAEEIKAIVRRTVASTGVWSANLSQISREIEQQPWVRTAVVSRVLPSGLRVRITERVPRAVVRTSGGRLVWVDEDGMMLSAVSSSDHMPTFFIRGWDETNTDAARAANRERLQKYLEMWHEWEAAGLAERVSEVNLDDLRDVRVQLAGDDSQIEVRLGKEDFGKRLSRALKAMENARQSARGTITRLDATQPGRVVVGFSSGTPSDNESAGDSQSNTASNAVAQVNRRDLRAKNARESRGEQKKNKDRPKHSNDQASGGTPAATRPRRVGRNG